MRRDPSKRPKPGVALASDDNRVPELADQPIVGAIMRHAVAWLFHGRPAGARRIGKARPTTFRLWLPVLVPPALGSIAAGMTLATTQTGLFVETLLWIATVGLGLVATAGVLVAAAIAHTLPPPQRPHCQEAMLPTGEPRPPYPPEKDAPLFEYVAGEVWLVERPFTFYGAEFGTRMTVLRLSDGGLLIHSPVEHSADLEASVRQLGEPRCIVAPNAFHHLYVQPWLDAFPDAPLLTVPDLIDRRPDLSPATEWPAVGDDRSLDLPFDAADVEMAAFEGHPLHRELGVYHARSGTLVLSDMLQNLGHEDDGLSGGVRYLLDLAQMRQRPTPPTDYKLGVDIDALARSLGRIQGWKFERIVFAHGRLVEREARETFRDAFAFVI